MSELILGTRLKRISDRLLFDVSKIYKLLNVEFEQSWFPIFYLLNKNGEMSVSEIADELEITHQAVSQFVGIFERKKLIRILKDNKDKRKNLIFFTQKGLKLVVAIKPAWKSIEKTMQGLLAEGPNSAYLFQALDELEDSLQREKLYPRAMREIKKRQVEAIEIIPYDSKYKVEFRKLMFSWLIDNHHSDFLDVGMINYPEKTIKENRGFILLVKIDDEIVAATVVERDESTTSNILYLVVEDQWRRRRIGKRLLLEVIKKLKKTGTKTIRIELNRRLTHVIKLFKNNGFELEGKEGEQPTNTLNGDSLVMEFRLDKNDHVRAPRKPE